MAGPKQYAKRVAKSLGYDIVRRQESPTRVDSPPQSPAPSEFDPETTRLFELVKPYTMTGIERVAALREAVQYIVKHRIPGDIAECGVWKGGSMMAIAKTLMERNSTERSLYLFDTFEGMPPPKYVDKDIYGRDAAQIMEQNRDRKDDDVVWAVGPLDVVKTAMAQTGYDPSRIQYVKGKVEDTIPKQAPNQIALLRLDTDWYESTYHELVHLFPRLSVGGVLIIDDYGHWQGARRAVDQYLGENRLKLLLNRIDYTARVAVKIE